MIERVRIIKLFDIYSSLFTDKQVSYFKDYYFEDLSLSEIANNYNVSKTIVSKTINKIEKKLEEYESNLKVLALIEKLTTIKENVKDESIKKELENIIISLD